MQTTSLTQKTADDATTGHPCLRPCNNGVAMVCEYDFTVEVYYVLSKACFDCPYNVTDCYRQHCVAADGVEKGIMTINRQVPGPPIQVTLQSVKLNGH